MQDHALQVSSLKYKPIHGLSSFLSFLPISDGAAVIKDTNREPHSLVIRHHRRSVLMGNALVACFFSQSCWIIVVQLLPLILLV